MYIIPMPQGQCGWFSIQRHLVKHGTYLIFGCEHRGSKAIFLQCSGLISEISSDNCRSTVLNDKRCFVKIHFRFSS